MRIVCQPVGKVTTEILSALLVICTRVTTLHSSYIKKNVPVFSQSDARNFFRYVISAQIGLMITDHVREFWLSVKLQIVFFQISHVHCGSTLDFDIAKRWNSVGQVSGICIFQILKPFVDNFRAIFWSSVFPNNERWRNHCHHLEITLVIKMCGTDIILLQDCTQYPDRIFEWASKPRLIVILE